MQVKRTGKNFSKHTG